jgi:hypothetical protein
LILYSFFYLKLKLLIERPKYILLSSINLFINYFSIILSTALKYFKNILPQEDEFLEVEFEIVKPKFHYIGHECKQNSDCNIFQDLICHNAKCLIQN